MISDKANEITDTIYKLYGTDSGCLFGMPPAFREAVSAVVEAAIFINQHDREADEDEIA
jgi:hypothetical protein